jgi:hypothetical protein
VDDSAEATSARGVIEAGSIGLLSNLERTPIDPASPKWLGQHARNESIKCSGLWNVDHVDGTAGGPLLEVLAYWVTRA